MVETGYINDLPLEFNNSINYYIDHYKHVIEEFNYNISDLKDMADYEVQKIFKILEDNLYDNLELAEELSNQKSFLLFIREQLSNILRYYENMARESIDPV